MNKCEANTYSGSYTYLGVTYPAKHIGKEVPATVTDEIVRVPCHGWMPSSSHVYSPHVELNDVLMTHKDLLAGPQDQWPRGWELALVDPPGAALGLHAVCGWQPRLQHLG